MERLSLDLRSATAGHACGQIIHLVTTVVALVAGQPLAALWILLPAIPLHAYPIMLQLVNLGRVEPVFDRIAILAIKRSR